MGKRYSILNVGFWESTLKSEKWNWAFFLPNSLNNPDFQKWPNFTYYYGFACMSHGCEGYFLLSNHEGWLQKGWFHGIFQENLHFLWNFPKNGVQKAIFNGKSHENSYFATASHGCKGENILRYHDSWLQKILFPLKPWLTVAKRVISWDFPNIFMKMDWLLKLDRLGTIDNKPSTD